MVEVHRIVVLLLIALLLPACGSSRAVEFESEPPMRGPEVQPVDDSGRETPLPKGFVADAATRIIHRADCPKVNDAKPADRVFYVTPGPALNEGYEPCDYCEPLKGWQ